MRKSEALAILRLTRAEKIALCDRVATGKASTKDFLHVMGLTMDQFLNYAQMSPERMRATAIAMRTRWGLD